MKNKLFTDVSEIIENTIILTSINDNCSVVDFLDYNGKPIDNDMNEKYATIDVSKDEYLKDKSNYYGIYCIGYNNWEDAKESHKNLVKFIRKNKRWPSTDDEIKKITKKGEWYE